MPPSDRPRSDAAALRPPRAEPPSQGIGGRAVAVLVLLAFVGGLIAMGWLMTNTDRLRPGASRSVATAEPTTPQPAATPALARLADSVDPVTGRSPEAPPSAAATNPNPPLAGSLGPVSEQVSTLESRLAGIRVAADGAAADARRAEAMLLAVAARRVLDRGVPLGFLQAQLRARFPGQPRAVDTVIDAAAHPVTIDSLREAMPDLAKRRSGGGFLSFVRGEGTPLIAFRRSDAPPSTAPTLLTRADQALARGDVAAALAQVEGLASTPERREWVRSARRYLAARQALDVIETAAILQGSGQPASGQAQQAGG